MSAPRIDCHGHVWSDEPSRYPYDGGRAPPAPTDKLGTAEVLLENMREANVGGFMIVQPIFHKFDDRYVTDTLEKFGQPFRGMLLIDPTLSPDAAVVELKRFHEIGYIGVRLNSGLWAAKGSDFLDATGRAVVAACGELNMSAGILCNNFGEQAAVINTLATEYPGTKMVLDHFAGLSGEDDPAWAKLVALAQHPNMHVKVSGWFRGGKDKYGAATLALLKAFGADRLMFGTDFPWVMGEGEAGYVAQWEVFDEWAASHLSSEETAALAGGTASKFFGFDTPIPPRSSL